MKSKAGNSVSHPSESERSEAFPPGFWRRSGPFKGLLPVFLSISKGLEAEVDGEDPLLALLMNWGELVPQGMLRKVEGDEGGCKKEV